MPQKGTILWEKAPNPRDSSAYNRKMIVYISIFKYLLKNPALVMGEKTGFIIPSYLFT